MIGNRIAGTGTIPAMDERFPTDKETLEKEVRMTFLRGSGPGGQHRNKVESGVRLFHPPSGITVTATSRRSQIQNRELAFELLIKKLETRNYRPTPRKKTKKPAKANRERIEEKKKRAKTKDERRKPDPE